MKLQKATQEHYNSIEKELMNEVLDAIERGSVLVYIIPPSYLNMLTNKGYVKLDTKNDTIEVVSRPIEEVQEP